MYTAERLDKANANSKLWNGANWAAFVYSLQHISSRSFLNSSFASNRIFSDFSEHFRLSLNVSSSNHRSKQLLQV